MSPAGEIRQQTERYLSSFRELNGGAPPWLGRLREEGAAAFAALGFPTTRLEDWKYTSVAPIASTPFRRPPAGDGGGRATAAAAGEARLGVGAELVFVNGRLAPALSSVSGLPPGVVVGGLAEALRIRPDLVEAHLGRVAPPGDESFTALNTAFLEDGALVHVPRGMAVGEPVHLVFLSLPQAEPVMSSPRILVIAEENAAVDVVESFFAGGEGGYLTNVATEIVVGRNASVSHCKVQRESERAFHVAIVAARQEASSRFSSQSISLGAALARNDVRTALEGEGAECTLDGLYVASGAQHVDHHTTIDHRRPRCSSRELYKGVLDGRSTGVFNGKVYVRADAQKSDARQANKNLLLSDSATVNTKPELQILADDVKCSHGATIGRLDENALFYLRSRGIDAETARRLLIHAFSNELVD
ncbi:MAG: Fe-S cluster assembly protein SufD, partial [Candidatus Binatia bacterium]